MYKEILQNPKSQATPCFRAATKLLTDQWMAWEPESIWLTLDREGVDVPEINREKLMAARSLITTGRFYYDASAFEKTAVCFSHELNTHLGVEDAPVAFINWAVFEADLLHKEIEHESLEVDHEPIRYTAVQLHREGFVTAPGMLSWAEPYLHKLCASDCKELAKKVKEGWAAAPQGEELRDKAFPETPAGVQLARLASVHLHFVDMLNERQRQLAKFRT